MDLNRVTEILSSEEEIAVHYHGIPVWIISVDGSSNLATVHARGAHDERRVIAIEELKEG